MDVGSRRNWGRSRTRLNEKKRSRGRLVFGALEGGEKGSRRKGTRHRVGNGGLVCGGG